MYNTFVNYYFIYYRCEKESLQADIQKVVPYLENKEKFTQFDFIETYENKEEYHLGNLFGKVSCRFGQLNKKTAKARICS